MCGAAGVKHALFARTPGNLWGPMRRPPSAAAPMTSPQKILEIFPRKKCIRCNANDVRTTKSSRGKVRLGYLCEPCYYLKNNLRRRASRHSVLKHKKTYCEKCGFVAVAACQLDVDHIDGNRENGSPENLQTLCSNCHRLKTFLNKESGSWVPKKTGQVAG